MNHKSLLVALATVVLAATGCTGGQSDSSGDGSETAKPVMIDQPDVGALDVAPQGARVDLEMPTFSDPTRIDNPLFPVGREDSNVLLGKVDGQKFRTEVTVLPETRFVEWEGQHVETVVSQYTAFLGGRIEEVALDLYAQDDDGAVWYFGEDVFNFEDGVVADTGGTWLAGKDGPAAMIMPAEPQVGDVYRPENIPGNVFEEVTVKSTDETVQGPQGEISGALLVSELHMDGQLEAKIFAPGYGEFYTSGGGDVEALALGLPTDQLSGSAARSVDRIWTASTRLYDATVTKRSQKLAASAVKEIEAAWADLSNADVPPLVRASLAKEIDEFRAAVDRPSRGQQSLDIARVALDLRLRHEPRAAIDLSRLDLWTRQLVIDIESGDQGGVAGDMACLDLVRDRVAHAYQSKPMSGLDESLGTLRVASVKRDIEAAKTAAAEARQTIAELRPVADG